MTRHYRKAIEKEHSNEFYNWLGRKGEQTKWEAFLKLLENFHALDLKVQGMTRGNAGVNIGHTIDTRKCVREIISLMK